MNFDNGYVLTLSDPQQYDASAPGPVLGNGKIAVVPRVKDLDTAQSMIAGDFPIRQGQYTSNLVSGFHFNRVQLFENVMADPVISYQLTSASLNMLTGIYTSAFNVRRGSQVLATLEQDLYALRPYPYCVMQSLRIRMTRGAFASAMTSSLPPAIFHHAYASSAQIGNPRFESVLVHGDRLNETNTATVTVGQGRYIDGSDAPGRTVAMASVYLCELDGRFKALGTNTFRFDPLRCYSKFALVLPAAGTGDTDNTEVEFRFHVLTAMMTDADFPQPLDEVKRIALNLMNKEQTHAAIAARLRAEHVRAWSVMWRSNLTIEPKTALTAVEAARVSRIARSLRYALFTLYSCTREGVNVEINPMNLSVADFDGSTITDGDLWIVPLLLFLKPDVARSMIEYKYKSLAVANQLAASYGYRGAKYPYHTDVIGYGSSLFWDTVSALYVFNTAVVAINAWNYYRVTSDREWLLNKGYPIIKSCADFLVSFVESLPVDPATGQPRFVFRRVMGLAALEGDDNAFTVYATRLALRYVLEASYDLQYPTRDAWSDVYYNIAVPFFTDDLNEVIRLHAGFASDASAPRPVLLEPLLLLLPYFNGLLFGTDTRLTASTLYKNLDFYQQRLPNEYVQHPVNLLLEAAMLAQLAQTDLVYIETFYAKIDEFLDTCTDLRWGNFTGFNRPPGSSSDLTLAAMFLLVVIQSLGGLRIAGGITETRFYYEELRIKLTRSGVMPRTWRVLRIDGIGRQEQTAVITNKLFYN